VLSTDADKLKFIRRLCVAPKFPVSRIQMWISTQQVNYYFTRTSHCVCGQKEKEKRTVPCFRRTQLFSTETRKCFILIIVQRDTTQSSLFIILQFHSTCFGCQPHPSSGVHKTVTTASDTDHIFCAATSLQ